MYILTGGLKWTKRWLSASQNPAPENYTQAWFMETPEQLDEVLSAKRTTDE
jgi:hypothetical protein